MFDFTFSMIKPDAYKAGHSGLMLAQIEKAGFIIRGLRLTRLSKEEAGAFYAIHRSRPFYADLCAYMSSGKIIAFVVEKEHAVSAYRELIGATDPKAAAAGTLRALYGSSIEANAVHGADSEENARIEASFFFPLRELLA